MAIRDRIKDNLLFAGAVVLFVALMWLSGTVLWPACIRWWLEK